MSAAVGAVANEPFFTFMRSQIFEPLSMRDTTPVRIAHSANSQRTE